LRCGAIESALDDRLDGPAVRHALPSDRECAQAGGVHSLGAVFPRAANDAEHRPVAHFGLRILSHRAANDFFDVRPERRGPTDQTLGRPVAVIFMRFRPVLRNRDWSAFSPVASAVRNDTRSAMPQLDDAGRSAQLEVLLAQLVGDAVMAALELDVVVDVCSHLLALRHLKAQCRQCPHRWPVDGLECLLVAFVALAKTYNVFHAMHIDGSFVTDKDDPGDIDAVLELTKPEAARLFAHPNAAAIIDAAAVKYRYEIHLFFAPQMTQFFQRLKPAEAIARSLAPDHWRGILKVDL